ncbi:MAG: HAD-IIIC family phosphatase, partial [Blastocatellia bacterium]
MNSPSYAQILANLDAEQLAALPRLKIAILRNVVVEPIVPYLRRLAQGIGFNAEARFGGYDNVYQEAVGGDAGLLDPETDCALVFLRLETLSWDLSRNFASLKPAEIEAEVERVKEFIVAAQAGIRRQTQAMILWCGFELPVYPALGIAERQRDNGQMAVIEELNRFLRAILRRHGNAYFVDLNLCLARVGARNFYDQRYWHIAKAPYSREALREVADEVFKYIRAMKGHGKKCLTLDCDNVLWGGTIGEDGLSGIKLGKTHPGSAYYEFQQEVLNLRHRGVVLALCSKNNEEDVWEVFRDHPDMVLRREHIAAARINWRDKADNLREIAAELNLGLDSLVFVDDSDFEVNLIRSLAPGVEVIELPGDGAVAYREALAACGYFDTLTLTKEDAERGVMYRAETARKQLQSQHQDLESYYASLEMALDIRLADEFSIPRISQLTQKTNQFNLTTRRYSDADIERLAEGQDTEVVYLRLRDRFGDSGIVGVCVLRYEDGRATFDSFLLSCRVLGRGVEDAFLTQCLKRAVLRQCKAAIGEYYPTAKNDQVKDFYLKHGFELIAEEDGIRRFKLGLTTFARSEPPYFQRIDSELDGTA